MKAARDSLSVWWPWVDASAITVLCVDNHSANASQGGLSLDIHSSATARYSALMNLFVDRPRGWIAFATVAFILLLPVALVLADMEETLDEEALQQARLVGQGGYAYQGKADIDGGGDLQVHGNRINKQDYDPAPYIGLRFVGGF
jgi:hypothetical protein